jgi:hypothetical protein
LPKKTNTAIPNKNTNKSRVVINFVIIYGVVAVTVPVTASTEAPITEVFIDADFVPTAGATL